VLEFIGSGLIDSDYLDVFIQRGREQDVMEAFAADLNRSGRILQLSQLNRRSCAASQLAGTLQGRGWTAADQQINVCPYIRLEGHTWESFLATLGSSQRYNFNRRLRKLAKSPEFAIRTLRYRADAVLAMDVVMALHRKRWGSAGASEAFQTPECVAFHREFAELAAHHGWLRLMEMRFGGAPVAALYGLRYGSKFYFYQSGFDPAHSKQSVGLVMMGLSIKAALDEGASEYDLLHGDEEYKFHWTQESRELGRLELYPPHARGRISRHAIAFNRAARRMAKRVLSNSE
jgi:CelD/BcsL family acetyltransferase involved in cellulose biosynthesis